MAQTKRKLILLGDGPDGPVSIDLDIFLRTRGFISASSGGGKSHTLRRLIEQAHPTVQTIVLDWEGEFSTLRNKFPFVLVGEGGETPAHPHTAAQVALTLLKLGTSAICDLYELRGNGRHEFVRNFVNAMVNAPKELWHPVLIIIDEAHYLCPENGYGESVAKDAIIDLCNLGRKRGFCAVLATQRASKVSKNATEPLQNFLIGLTMPDDQKRICETFKVAPGAATREFSKVLEELEQGQFFGRGAAISKTPVLIQVGKTETQPPPTGTAAAARKSPTPDAIKKLLPQLADIPVEAEKTLATEKDLRKKIAELEKSLRDSKRAPTTIVGNVTSVGKSTFTPEREKMLLEKITTLEANTVVLRKTAGAYDKAMDRIYSMASGVMTQADSMKAQATNIQQQIQTIRGEAATEMEKVVDVKPIPAAKANSRYPHPIHVKPHPAERRPDVDRVDAGLGKAEQAILNAFAWFEGMGISAPRIEAVSAISGYSMNSSSFRGAKSKLSIAKFIDGGSITEAGIAAATDSGIEESNAGIQQAVFSKLGKAESALLRLLVESYPEQVSNETLSEKSGYSMTSSSFRGARSTIKVLGFAEYRGDSMIATDVLFPEGV